MFRLMNKCKNKKGFTLIELIVVLAVLGIIAAIAVPKYLGVQDKAKADADDATVELVKSALELCIATEDIALPQTDSASLVTLSSGALAVSYSGDEKFTGDLLKKYLDITTAKLNSGSVTLYIDKDGKIHK